MIKLKVIAMSASGKSALCSALFTSEVGVGNVRVSAALEVGSVHDTAFKTCSVKQTIAEDGETVFNWLVLGL